MRKFAIVTDSTSDLNKETREALNIDYVMMNYVIDTKEYPASLDWETHSVGEYYDMMRNGTRVRTTQVPRETFEACFEGYLKEDTDVIYISCSSALSGSVGLGVIVAEELMQKYPGSKIVCVDSLISSVGQGYLVITAAKLREEGKTIDEVVDYLVANRLKVNQFGTVESLEYLRRAGRVKASKAFFGKLFGIKPIIISDIKGQNFAFKKVKGALNCRKEIATQIADVVINPEEQTLYLSHADVPEEIEALRDEILKLAAFKDVYINNIGPIVGASVGPGTVIAFCVGKEVTIEGNE